MNAQIEEQDESDAEEEDKEDDSDDDEDDDSDSDSDDDEDSSNIQKAVESGVDKEAQRPSLLQKKTTATKSFWGTLWASPMKPPSGLFWPTLYNYKILFKIIAIIY